jgi:hypothetical protein
VSLPTVEPSAAQAAVDLLRIGGTTFGRAQTEAHATTKAVASAISWRQ